MFGVPQTKRAKRSTTPIHQWHTRKKNDDAQDHTKKKTNDWFDPMKAIVPATAYPVVDFDFPPRKILHARFR